VIAVETLISKWSYLNEALKLGVSTLIEGVKVFTRMILKVLSDCVCEPWVGTPSFTHRWAQAERHEQPLKHDNP
jgi:hypothetical protein